MSKHHRAALSKLPIWVKDMQGNEHQVKIGQDGVRYLIDPATRHKVTFDQELDVAEVGKEYPRPSFNENYTVVRNDLLSMQEAQELHDGIDG